MLEIRHLTKTYPNGVAALRGVDLEIPRGMFGLLGPNGAGKSTLMRTIATLQEADSGSIMFGDLDVLRQKERVRQILGYLPQEFGVYPKISAEDMLTHFAVLKGIVEAKERKRTVEALLRQTNLWDVRHRKLGTYSGGMRQRFGIAQALLGNPQLIIVDEPTAGLDPEERQRFLNLLAEIGENVVVILSTHIVADVADLCPRMAIISKGEVLLSGQPKTAIAALDGRVFEKAIAKADLASYESRMRVLSTRLVAGATVIHVHADADAADPAGSGTVNNDATALLADGFNPVAPDLEDVYFLHLKHRQTLATPTAAAA